MNLSFRYKSVKLKYRGTSLAIKRPIIPITLGNGDKNIDVEGFIDSGSDFMVITKEIADYLGIPINKETEEIGLMGSMCKMVNNKMNMKIADERNAVRMNSLPVEIIIDGQDKLEEILIGRIPFFSEFDVCFRENSNRIELIRTKRR